MRTSLKIHSIGSHAILQLLPRKSQSAADTVTGRPSLMLHCFMITDQAIRRGQNQQCHHPPTSQLLCLFLEPDRQMKKMNEFGQTPAKKKNEV